MARVSHSYHPRFGVRRHALNFCIDGDTLHDTVEVRADKYLLPAAIIFHFIADNTVRVSYSNPAVVPGYDENFSFVLDELIWEKVMKLLWAFKNVSCYENFEYWSIIMDLSKHSTSFEQTKV